MSKAIRALEMTAVTKIGDQLRSLQGRVVATIAKAVRDNPSKSFAVLWADTPELERALAKSIQITQDRIRSSIKAGSLAASKLAKAELKRDYGIQLDASTENIDIDDLLNDVDGYMLITLEAIKLEISRAYQAPLTDRRRAVEEGIAKVVRGLLLRAKASASVVMVRTYNETLQQGLAKIVAGDVKIRKTWQVTSDNPCKRCVALNGKTIDLDGDFYRDSDYSTQTPPLHVRCACVIVLESD